MNGPVNRAEKMRALYPGGRPSAEAKAIHRRFIASPLPRVLPIASVLEVRGRRSGVATLGAVGDRPLHGFVVPGLNVWRTVELGEKRPSLGR